MLCKVHSTTGNNSDFPAIIWVKFEDECIGSEQHKKYSYLVKRKQISKEWTPIFAQKRSFLIKSVWVTHVQYPLRHATARTIHVAQSATFKNIYIDMDTNTNPPKHWWKHMHYVALSRLNHYQVYISKVLIQIRFVYHLMS